ncbi:hypothetical protein VRY54_09305 [Actinomyces sp. F1_1611]
MGQGRQVWRRWPVVAGVVALVLALAGAGAAWAVVSHQNNLKIQAWTDAAGELAGELDLADAALVRASELDQATGDLGLEEARQELNTKTATLKAGVKGALTDHPAIERRVADQSDTQSGAQSGAQSGGANGGGREVYVVNAELRPPVGELEQSRAQLEEAQVALEAATSDLEDVSASVAGEVAAAREELQGAVSGAVADLQAQVEAASKVLTDSKGKVADDKTRTALDEALGAAKSLVEQLSKPLSDVDLVGAEALVGEQVKALQGAQKKVDASIAQKSAADTAAQAASQAAANNGGGGSAGEGWTGSWDSDWSEGGSWGDWTGSTGSSGSGGYVPQSDRCDPRWPCSVTGDDGITHNQIWPDSNGSYTHDMGEL